MMPADPPRPLPPEREDDRPANILIVDDTPGHLSLLVDALHSAGFRPLVAPSGESALQRLATVVPDLVLLDMRMPGLDGLATLARLRELPAARHLPVIFMTAVEEPEQKVAAFAAGAVDYVTKPFHPSEVIARIELHLRLVRTQGKLSTELAWREQTERTLQAALEQAVLVVGAGGRVQFVTPRATHLLDRYFPGERSGGLPGPVVELLAPWRSAQASFAEKCGTLVVRVIADPGAGEAAMILLEERRAAGDYEPLRRLGLSERETEVLYWMSEGKSNPEIGIIVGAAAATVKKHAENLYFKLGVDNRAAATRLAMECLQGR
jgi:DNA-binding response OmpR family regulator/DNA-binding CsgD family transcriptional regulator